VSPVDLKVIELSVSKVDSIGAEEIFRVLKFNIQLKLSAANVREADSDGIEAHTLIGDGRASRSNLTTEDRQELELGIGFVVAVSASVLWTSVIVIGRSATGENLLSQVLEVMSLLLIVIDVLLAR